MNTMIFQRRKVRNCIRKDTYRYIINDEFVEEIWSAIEKTYGMAKELMEMRLAILETTKFKIVKPLNENSFTLIRKKCFSEKDEIELHAVMGCMR